MPEDGDNSPRHVDVWNDLASLKALMHPLRLRAFVLAGQGEVSAKELAQQLGVPLQRMSYHVRLLADAGLLTVVRRTPRRGAVETHYRAVGAFEVSDEALEASPETHALWAQILLQLIAEDANHAISGGASAGEDFVLARAHFSLDDAGRARLIAEMEAFYDRLAALAQELHVDGGAPAHELNLALLLYRGARAGGRNGPIFDRIGHNPPLIPPE